MGKSYSLKRDTGPDVAFYGEKIAEVDSRDYKRGARQERWTEMVMYKSGSGKIVVSISGRSIVPGEVDRLKVKVCEDIEEVFKKVGFSHLAKALYEEAGIKAEVHI